MRLRLVSYLFHKIKYPYIFRKLFWLHLRLLSYERKRYYRIVKKKFCYHLYIKMCSTERYIIIHERKKGCVGWYDMEKRELYIYRGYGYYNNHLKKIFNTKKIRIKE